MGRLMLFTQKEQEESFIFIFLFFNGCLHFPFKEKNKEQNKQKNPRQVTDQRWENEITVLQRVSSYCLISKENNDAHLLSCLGPMRNLCSVCWLWGFETGH